LREALRKMRFMKPIRRHVWWRSAAVAAAITVAVSWAGAERPPLDRSGAPQVGIASYYADRFAWRTMANGEPFDPESNVAASRTLPLGTKARVTNLENGRSAVVEIKDRGPYIKGRIIDLSPRIARRLGMIDDGIVRVAVEPLATTPRAATD
jgi:rare lipoprotein A